MRTAGGGSGAGILPWPAARGATSLAHLIPGFDGSFCRPPPGLLADAASRHTLSRGPNWLQSLPLPGGPRGRARLRSSASFHGSTRPDPPSINPSDARAVARPAPWPARRPSDSLAWPSRRGVVVEPRSRPGVETRIEQPTAGSGPRFVAAARIESPLILIVEWSCQTAMLMAFNLRH